MPHPPTAESSSLGSYLNRSFQETHNERSTQTIPRLPEILRPAWISQAKCNFKTVSILFSPYCLTMGSEFNLLSSKWADPTSAHGTLAPEATNSSFRFSHGNDVLSDRFSVFPISKHGLSTCCGLHAELWGTAGERVSLGAHTGAEQTVRSQATAVYGRRF